MSWRVLIVVVLLLAVILISIICTLLYFIFVEKFRWRIEKEDSRGYATLNSTKFIIKVNLTEGSIVEIYNPRDTYLTNFAGNRENHEFIRRGLAPPLGEVCLKYRVQGSSNWVKICTSNLHENMQFKSKIGDDYVVFVYEIEETVEGRKSKILYLEKRYVIDINNEFLFEIILKNLYERPVEVGELSIPLSFNLDCWSQEAYDKQVLIHPFISGHSSFIYLTRPNGIPPFLIITPGNNTYFEAITGQWSLGIIKQPPPILYLYAKANEKEWKKWFNGYSSLMLLPGEQKKHQLLFGWVEGYHEILRRLYELGKISIEKIIPAMVLPLDLEAYVVIRSKKLLNRVYVEGNAELEINKKDEDKYIIKLKFNSLGEHILRIKYGDNEWVNIPFYAIDNIEQLLKKRAEFIVRYQRIMNPNDIRYYAFLMWDSENKTILDSAPPLLDYGPGWPRPPYSWMNGCSDEIGFAEPLTLAIKNLYYPNEEEIKALEDYIWHFLYGKLQDKQSFGVKRWIWDDPPPGYHRSFNYPHVFSLYYTMYKIAKNYPALVRHKPEEYLLLAYNTAMAFHNDQLVGTAWHYIGHMNQWTLLEILKALKEEGFRREYLYLYSKMKISADYFTNIRYPYLSEFPFDTTGYETVYFYRKWMNRTDLVMSTVNILLATLHHVPIWWWYGADIKGIGTYTTALNDRVLLDAFETYFRKSDNYYRELLLRIAYAGIIGYLSNLHPTGEATTGPDWSPDHAWGHYFNSKWSNEYGIGLYAVGYALKSYVIVDPDLGTVCYGCKVYEDDIQYAIEPYDGLRTRVLIDPPDLNIEIEKGRIGRLIISKVKNRITLFLEKAHPTVDNVVINLSGLTPGKYSIYVNNALLTYVNVQDKIISLPIPATTNFFLVEIISI